MMVFRYHMSQGKGGSIIASAKCHTGGMYPTAGNVSGSDTMAAEGGSSLEEKAAELDSVAATSTAPTTTSTTTAVVAGGEGLEADGITLEIDDMINPSTAVMNSAAELCGGVLGKPGSNSGHMQQSVLPPGRPGDLVVVTLGKKDMDIGCADECVPEGFSVQLILRVPGDATAGAKAGGGKGGGTSARSPKSSPAQSPGGVSSVSPGDSQSDTGFCRSQQLCHRGCVYNKLADQLGLGELPAVTDTGDKVNTGDAEAVAGGRRCFFQCPIPWCNVLRDLSSLPPGPRRRKKGVGRSLQRDEVAVNISMQVALGIGEQFTSLCTNCGHVAPLPPFAIRPDAADAGGDVISLSSTGGSCVCIRSGHAVCVRSGSGHPSRSCADAGLSGIALRRETAIRTAIALGAASHRIASHRLPVTRIEFELRRCARSAGGAASSPVMSPSSPDGSYGSPGSPGSPGSDAMFDNDVVLDAFDSGKEGVVVGVGVEDSPILCMMVVFCSCACLCVCVMLYVLCLYVSCARSVGFVKVVLSYCGW